MTLHLFDGEQSFDVNIDNVVSKFVCGAVRRLADGLAAKSVVGAPYDDQR